MENQPPPTAAVRPIFRLASIARLEGIGPALTQIPNTTTDPAPTNATETPRIVRNPTPKIPLPRSLTVTTNGTQVTEPRPTNSPTAQRFKIPSRESTPQPESPKVIRQAVSTPAESPTFTQLKPIKAPPPQPEPESKPVSTPNQRGMLMQQGNRNSSFKSIDEKSPLPSTNRETNTTVKKNEKNGEAMNVISMLGDNTGAYMELGPCNGQQNNKKQQQKHGYFLYNHENNESHGDIENAENKKERGNKSIPEVKPMMTVVNSNVQSVNNSIIFRSSCSQKSPGVHVSLASQKQPKC